MVLVVAVLRVVVAHHIHRLWVGGLVGHDHACQRSGHRTARVHLAYAGCQPFGYLADAQGVGCVRVVAAEHGLVDGGAVQHRVGVRVVGVVHLVADAPEEDRRMVAVAADHVRHVTVNPFLEEVEGAVERRFAHVPPFDPLALGELPLVRCFVHD